LARAGDLGKKDPRERFIRRPAIGLRRMKFAAPVSQATGYPLRKSEVRMGKEIVANEFC